MTEENESNTQAWPPSFTLDQERILNLLMGDRFYSDASASLREAVLNAIDAIHRRNQQEPDRSPAITVTFDRNDRSLTVSDNGDGMDRSAIINLFTRVGATAAKLQSGKGSVGEFGIGVISYFMAGDSFSIQTFDGSSEPIALKFTRKMLAGGSAEPFLAARETRGTALQIDVRDDATFDLLLKKFPHWCRDVEGLAASELPQNHVLSQGGFDRPLSVAGLQIPKWVERAHLAPISGIGAWDSMAGTSTISILYRGIFVQEFTVRDLWGVKGSIDVDPKHFKPRLNREGFVEGAFQAEVEQFLRQSHPKILLAMADQLSNAIAAGQLDKWNQRRWATLWLSIPRDNAYADVAKSWDKIFRKIPAFELAVGNKWDPISLEELIGLGKEVYVAPHPEENSSDVIKAAIRLLRHTDRKVIRGLRPDRGWLKDAKSYFSTTADLITSVFASELPKLIPVHSNAEAIVSTVGAVSTLFSGTPPVELVRLGAEAPPILPLSSKLIINLDHPRGKAIVDEAMSQNTGRWSLIAITARHSFEHLQQVASAVRKSPPEPEPLGLVKRRMIRGLLT
jgi:Histidine kinase-, DNA gyrase B-, and HSP90-like ATPase